VLSPDFGTTAVAYGMGNDGKIHEASNGGSWSKWTTLSLDASGLDARSDLDCSGNSSVTHIVATGSSPIGAFLHAEGAGTTFNPFFRELTSETFTPPGASVQAYPNGNNYEIGALDANPIYYDIANGMSTQVFSVVAVLNSAIDISMQACCGGALRLIVGFDNVGMLELLPNYISSAGPMPSPAATFSAPSGTTYSYSPSVCVDTGAMGGSDIHVVAVAGGKVYDRWASNFNGMSSSFTAWQQIGTGAASAPDCAMMSDESVHVVVLNSAGHVLDIHGTGSASWTTTDLGAF
jgi:hypothetical protein